MSLFILFETASGYSLFERIEAEDIGKELDSVQQAVSELGKFSKIVRLKSFVPFKSAAHALENINDVTEGVVNEHLKNFLEVNLPQTKGKSKFQLGVAEPKIGGAIQEALSITCVSSDIVHELLRGIRLHIDKLISQFKEGDLEKAQLGLGHSYSRAKVKFNVNRADNMVTQSVSLLDQLDKDLNTFSMRVREWYSWHFPELVKIVGDNYLYARLVKFVQNKGRLSEAELPGLEEIVQDETKAKQILDAARASMGTDISEVDLLNIESFANRVISLHEYRKSLYEYLCNKMHNIAPNLSSLIGEVVGARLISKAGSLTNLSKYPASTVQILGAEKALFRALKTKGNTPKYGLIFHSSFIGKAGAKNKGRISRYLANKCSIASRIDCFSEQPTSKFGEALKKQVDQRLDFYDHGEKPPRNVDVMHGVIEEIRTEAVETPKSDKKRKAQKSDEMEIDEDEEPKKKKVKEAASAKKTPKKAKEEKEEKEEAPVPVSTKKTKKAKEEKEEEAPAPVSTKKTPKKAKEEKEEEEEEEAPTKSAKKTPKKAKEEKEEEEEEAPTKSAKKTPKKKGKD